MYNESAMNTSRLSTHQLSTDAEIREARPFYVIVMIVLAGLYALALFNSPDLRDPVRLAVFSALMLVHAALHWQSTRVVGNRRASLIYLTIQGALVFVLPIIATSDFLVLGLSMALIGEAVGMLWDIRWVALALVVYVALAALDLITISGTARLPSSAVSALPMTVFVIVYVVLYSRQARARAHAQALLDELETAHRQLAEYAARVEDLTLASERQRMARELHDTLAQGLAGLVLQLEAANTHLASGRSDRAQAILQQSMSRARATLADARRAIDDLRAGQTAPRALDEAVREQVARFTDATGIPCALDAVFPAEMPATVQEYALRAVTEGLTNIARHAQARHVWVRLAREGDMLTVELRDDGRGFDPAAVPAGHYGLLGMRERARLVDGRLDVSSAPGAGTTLRLQLALGTADHG